MPQQGQPGALRAGTPGGTRPHPPSSRSCTWPPPSRSTSAPTAPGTPSGRRSRPWHGAPSWPLRRPPSSSTGLQVDAGRMAANPMPPRAGLLAEQAAVAEHSGGERPTRPRRTWAPAPRSCDAALERYRGGHPMTPPHRGPAAARATRRPAPAGARTLARHLRDRAVVRAPPRCSATPSTWSPGTSPATAPTPAADGAVHDGRARAGPCSASSTSPRRARSSPAAPSPTPATRSAVPSACSCCSTHPARVRSAVLLCTGARIGDAGGLARARRAGPRVGHAGDGRAARPQRWFAPGFLDARARDHRRPPARPAGRGPLRLRRGVRGARRASTSATGWARSPRRCSPSPATNDTVARPGDGTRRSRRRRAGRAVVLPGVAHLAPAEAPPAVAALIRGTLAVRTCTRRGRCATPA